MKRHTKTSASSHTHTTTHGLHAHKPLHKSAHPSKLTHFYQRSKKKNAFTLIELMVVIAILSILATVIVSNINNARKKAQIARATRDLQEVKNAVFLLEQDTNKWPGGCPPATIEDPESDIESIWAGIIVAPHVGIPVTGRPTNCEWTSNDVAAWKGPYWTGTGVDPWGVSYFYDPDYCMKGPKLVSALVSVGPDGREEYGSDDCGPAYRMSRPANPNTDDVVLPLAQYPI